jgi:tetratricopeptide (TPR) repeat protein
MHRHSAQQFISGMILAIVSTTMTARAIAQTKSLTAAINAERSKLNDSHLRGEERLATIEHVLDLRRQLIATRPNDPLRPVWLADQSSDLLFELLTHDGLVLTAMFGAPTLPQLERVRMFVREAFESAEQAETAVAATIVRLESTPGIARDDGAQQLRRELAEVQRDRRIPYLRGISAYMHATFNVEDDAQQRSQLALADRLLSPLIEKLQGAPAIEARSYAGLAKARLSEFEAAEALFAQVARDVAASPAQIFTARMGGVINRANRNGIRSGLDALTSIEHRYVDSSDPANLFYRILIADHAFNLRRQYAEQFEPPQRDQFLAEAFGAYTTLLNSNLGASRETVRAVVFARLTNAISLDENIPLDAMPGLVSVAYAEQLSRNADTRERAIVLLEQALEQQRLDAEARPAALFVLARSLLEHGGQLFAARRFIELASHYPADHQAQRAIELGVTIAADLHRQSPQDDEARTALRDGLQVMLEKYPNLSTINRWRYAAARLALDEARFDEALQLLAQVTPDAEEWADAHFMQVSIGRERALRADSADATRLNQQVVTAIEHVQPILQASVSTADTNRAGAIRDYLGLLRVYRAEALLRMNQPQAALQALTSIEQETETGTVVLSEALRVRISSYQSLRQPEDAQREIENFARTSPQQVPLVLPSVLAAMRRDVDVLLESGRETESRELAARTMLPTGEILESAIRQQSSDSEQHRFAQYQIAAAYLLSGRYAESAARYDRLLRDNPNAAEVLLGRAESLFGLGGEQQLADAMAIYKRFAAAGPESNPGQYWLSHLRMLQIVDRVNRNTDQILPRIERLRQQDRDFGGERYKQGFETLRMKYAAKG